METEPPYPALRRHRLACGAQAWWVGLAARAGELDAHLPSNISYTKFIECLDGGRVKKVRKGSEGRHGVGVWCECIRAFVCLFVCLGRRACRWALV